jgi:hypothetical protein
VDNAHRDPTLYCDYFPNPSEPDEGSYGDATCHYDFAGDRTPSKSSSQKFQALKMATLSWPTLTNSTTFFWKGNQDVFGSFGVYDVTTQSLFLFLSLLIKNVQYFCPVQSNIS